MLENMINQYKVLEQVPYFNNLGCDKTYMDDKGIITKVTQISKSLWQHFKNITEEDQ